MDLERTNPVDRVGGGRTRVAVAAALAVLLLIGAGVSYRVAASSFKNVWNTPIELPVSLRKIPMEINGWVGEELEIPEITQVYMKTNFADDYVSRRYTRVSDGIRGDVYVVYCSSRPHGIIGHKPGVCFPAHGWVWDSTSPSEIVLDSGRSVKCLIHRFHRPAPAYQEVVILNFYVVNGQVTLNEGQFAGLFGRRPNILGNPARYVAQIQISSVLEHSVRTTASQIVDTILAFLPDQDGHVEVAGITNEEDVDRTAGAVEGNR